MWWQSLKYERYVILGDSRTVSFWDCAHWVAEVFPALDMLLAACEFEPSVESRQVVGAGSRPVQFGKIRWSTDDAEKWCHGPRTTGRDEWRFVDLQVFCPAKSRLIRNRGLPSIYIQMKPMIRGDMSRRTAYDEGIHLAFAERFSKGRRETVDSAVATLSATRGVVAVYHATTRIRQLNAFESTVREDFMYQGWLETPRPRRDHVAVPGPSYGRTVVAEF